jgi:hypothetical protein
MRRCCKARGRLSRAGRDIRQQNRCPLGHGGCCTSTARLAITLPLANGKAGWNIRNAGRPNGNRFAIMDHDRILRLSAVLWKTGLPKSG